MIRVAPDRKGKDDRAGTELPEPAYNRPAGLVGIVEVCIRQPGVRPLGDPEHFRRLRRLALARASVPLGPCLSCGEIENAGAVPRSRHLGQGAAAR